MCKTICVIGLVAVMMGASVIGHAAGNINVTAKSAIVIEAKTGQVIYEQDAESRRYPASTTKMMTLLLALEKGNLNDIVTASKTASETDGSSIWLENGEKQRLEDLLYAIMLVSGNDATVAVAEHIAGSVDAFAKQMTAKAKEIGATNTVFMNSSGLPDPNHYSTAHDLAKIAAYGYKNPLFAKIVSTKEKVIPWAGKDYGRDLGNENKLLWIYDGGNGVKTGYTEAAGHCLVAAAERNGIQLIAVVLDSEAMWQDSMALLDYGFQHSSLATVLQQGSILKTVKVVYGYKDAVNLVVESNVDIPVVQGDKEKISTVVEAPNSVKASVREGQVLGKVKVLYDGNEVAVANLVAEDSIERKSLFDIIYNTIYNGIKSIWNWWGQQ